MAAAIPFLFVSWQNIFRVGSKPPSMKVFRIGCYILLTIALSHSIGQLFFTEPKGQAEKEAVAFMQTHSKIVAGGKMSLWDIQNGLSWCYALFFASIGSLNLYLSREISESHLKTVSWINAITFLLGSFVSLVYFFWLPVLSFATASCCFFLAAIRLRKTEP